MMTSARNTRIFDPNAGSGSMLVAVADERGLWQRELRDFNAEREEREIRHLMANRHGVCG